MRNISRRLPERYQGVSREATMCFRCWSRWSGSTRGRARRSRRNSAAFPYLRSDSHDMYELVSILRCSSLIVSSRYHAMVTSMPGLVPSAGITMDERIRNLLRDRGHENLLLTVDDPDLEAKLLAVMEASRGQTRTAYADGIGRCVVRNLKTMARMGMYLERAVQERYPEFPDSRGRARLGRISCRRSARISGSCWTLTRARLLPRPEIRR